MTAAGVLGTPVGKLRDDRSIPTIGGVQMYERRVQFPPPPPHALKACAVMHAI